MALLAEIDDFKLELGITSADDDAVITRFLTQASGKVETHLGFDVEHAARVYSTHIDHPVSVFVVPFYPVTAVTSVTQDGEAVAGFTFAENGLVRAPSGCVFCGDVSIAADAGWYLADDAPNGITRNLPTNIEAATIALARAAYLTRDRDPTISAEAVPGVHSVQYGSAAAAGSVTVSSVSELLEPYRIGGFR